MSKDKQESTKQKRFIIGILIVVTVLIIGGTGAGAFILFSNHDTRNKSNKPKEMVNPLDELIQGEFKRKELVYEDLQGKWVFLKYTRIEFKYEEAAYYDFTFDEEKKIEWGIGYYKSERYGYYEGTYEINDDVLILHLVRLNLFDVSSIPYGGISTEEVDITYKFNAEIKDGELVLESADQNADIIGDYSAENNMTLFRSETFWSDTDFAENYYKSVMRKD